MQFWDHDPVPNNTPWDVYAAEFADIQRGNHRPKRPCIYCGLPTRAISGACTAHDDLPEFDTNVPTLADELLTALEGAWDQAVPLPLPPLSHAPSSAAGTTRGHRPAGSLETGLPAARICDLEPCTGFPVHGAEPAGTDGDLSGSSSAAALTNQQSERSDK